jgi:hypothetical protein
LTGRIAFVSGRVVADLVDAGACELVATLRPVITYKTRRR